MPGNFGFIQCLADSILVYPSIIDHFLIERSPEIFMKFYESTYFSCTMFDDIKQIRSPCTSIETYNNPY